MHGTKGALDVDKWYHVRIEVRGSKCRCLLDGQDLFGEMTDERRDLGRVGLSTTRCAARFRNLVVSTPDGKPLWQGVPTFPPGYATPQPIEPKPQSDAPAKTEATTTRPVTNEQLPPAEIIGGATWHVDANGELLKSGVRDSSCMLFFGDPAWSNYNLELQAQITSGLNDIIINHNAFIVEFHATSSKTRRGFIIGTGPNVDGFGADTWDDGKLIHETGDFRRGMSLVEGRWYDVRVEVRGGGVPGSCSTALKCR